MLSKKMFHLFNTSRLQILKKGMLQNLKFSVAVPLNSHKVETPEEFDKRYEDLFNRPDIDGWEIRRLMYHLHGEDLVPDPKIICAALRACRRVSDYSLGVRFLEAVKLKCGNKLKKIYPYILHEIQPTLDELGLDLPEQLGFDKPELALENVYSIH